MLPERARSKSCAARSRAAGGREEGSAEDAEGEVVEEGFSVVDVGGGTVVCVEGGRGIMAGCGPVGSIGVGCVFWLETDEVVVGGEEGRAIGIGILGWLFKIGSLVIVVV